MRRTPDERLERLADARAEAQRRLDRRESRAQAVDRLATIDEEIAAIERLLAGMPLPLAGAALRAEIDRLQEERVRTKIAINSTSTTSWGLDEDTIHAHDGEGLTETTWRVLLDRGATGHEMATLAGEGKDGALRKRIDRWRAKARGELIAYRDELRAAPFPWKRTRELLAAVEGMIEQLD